MAIRPVDLQGVIAQSAQAAPLSRQSEEAVARSQAVAQNVFVGKLEERQETVAETDHASGNKVKPKEERDRQQAGQRKDKRRPGDPFDEVVDRTVFGSDDEPHIIDFSA